MMGFSCRLICAAIIICFPILGVAQKSPVSKGTPVCDELYRTGQYETALNCYQKALAEGADNPALYLRLCKVYEALGEVDKIQQYLPKVDSTSTEARDFLEMLKSEYGTLNIRCSGQAKCPIYFVSRPSLNFIAPTELESGRAKRLLAINELYSKRSNIWFRKINPDEYIANIGYFPIVSGAPLPYKAEIADNQFEFNFNFIERGELCLSYRDLDSVYCGVPDSIVEVRISIDDPDFEAVISNGISGDDRTELLDGRYYFKQGDKPTLAIQKKDRVLSGRKYFIVSSLVLTSAFILLQR
jgi:tetratricopeptide (TPR) repeat protein